MNKALVAQGFLCIVTALGLSAVQLMSPSTRANALETALQTEAVSPTFDAASPLPAEPPQAPVMAQRAGDCPG